MKKAIIGVLGLFFTILVISCTSNSDFEKGKRNLEAQGYTNVINTGYSAFCCADEDTYSTGFEATSPSGDIIEGCFCSTALKGVTVRFK